LVFGCSKGKNIQYCLKNIFPRAQTVFLVKADHPRARDPLDIYTAARKFQKNVVIAPSVQTVLEYAKKPQKKTTVVITGSFYLWQKNWSV
jgi:folylpolyglutamate synthase/dihydropteroate synthase